MTEFFIVARSFAAPWVSDTDTAYQEAETAREALELFAATYKHPFGLYAAEVYEGADAYHKNEKPLAQWLCNHEQARQRLTADVDGYSYLGHGPGNFEIDGKRHIIPDPKAGSVVERVQ